MPREVVVRFAETYALCDSMLVAYAYNFSRVNDNGIKSSQSLQLFTSLCCKNSSGEHALFSRDLVAEMEIFSQYLLFAITAIFVPLRASPIGLQQLPNQTASDFNASSFGIGIGLQCFEGRMFNSRRDAYTDCARAIARLPYSCQVSISTRDYPSRDESSWIAIHVAASDILNGCAMGYGQHAMTGGETTVGTNDGIQVTMERMLLHADS